MILSLYFFSMSLANHYEMRRFTRGPEIFDGPLVSVFIPMRNEEKNAENCLEGLRNQSYKNYEILVLDDNSTDNTASILKKIAAEDKRIKVFTGSPLPDDWYGKPFALHQLSLQANGEIFFFTDADTIHSPESISWAVTNMSALKTDMITGYIGQIFKEFGEIVTVPLRYFLTGFIIPIFLNRITRVHWFSIAIGQYIVIKSDVFRAIGGCEAFRKKTSEDMYMAQHVKKLGYSIRFLNITKYVKCRMYEGYRCAIEGIGKNVFDFLGKNTLIIFLMAVCVLFFVFLPFVLLFICIFINSQWLFLILLVNVLYTLTWFFIFLDQRINWWYCFLWPLMCLNLLYMAWWSWYRTISGKGFLWKGRKIN